MQPQLIPYFCVGFIIGVGAGSAFSPVATFVFWSLLSICAFLLLGLRGAIFRFILFFCAALLLGLFISDLANRRDRINTLYWSNATEKIAKFEGLVRDVEQDGLSLKLLVHQVKRIDESTVLPGILEIKTAASESFRDGDEIVFMGKIGIPENYSRGAGHFDPRRYYARYGIYASMVNPRIQVGNHGNQNLITSFRKLLRNRFALLLPEPDAGLFSATLLGFMHDVPKSLRTEFSNSGLAHLVAISGQHVGMLAVAVFFVATLFGVRRLYAMLVAAVISTVFIILVDFPPSGIRSVVMVMGLYWAYASGRKSQAFRVLMVTIVLMLAANPRILLADLGFQLSALAMWGLIVFYPLGISLKYGTNSFGLSSIFLMTASAMFTTTPIIAYSFGRISLAGLISNVFAAPLYPPLMFLGVIVLILGWVPFLQSILFLVTHSLTTIFLNLVTFSSNLPGANIQLAEIESKYVLFFYLMLFVLSLLLSRSTRRQFWPPSPQLPHTKDLFMLNTNCVCPEQLRKKVEK